MLSKADQRRAMGQRLRLVSAAQWREASEAIGRQVRALPELAGAGSVFCYVSRAGEVATEGLIGWLLARGVALTVPFVGPDEHMQACRITALADLKPGRWGILEPIHPRPLEGTPAVCLMPGLAFTARGDRLGRGKGYYDGFLARHPRTLAIALALEAQIVPELATTERDQPVAAIVTEGRVLRCR